MTDFPDSIPTEHQQHPFAALMGLDPASQEARRVAMVATDAQRAIEAARLQLQAASATIAVSVRPDAMLEAADVELTLAALRLAEDMIGRARERIEALPRSGVQVRREA